MAGSGEMSMSQFRDVVKQYITVTDNVKHLQKALKEKRGTHTQLKDLILAFMNENEIDVINTPHGKFKRRVSYVKGTVSHKEIKERLATIIQNEEKCNQLIAQLYSAEKKERTTLSLSQPESQN